MPARMGPASSSVVTLEIRSLAEQVRTRLISISGYGVMDSPVVRLMGLNRLAVHLSGMKLRIVLHEYFHA